jgi:hydroxymethylglutaryl-CoA lyase
MKIIECPRDAMQGIRDFVPTSLKATYINHLLQVGFDTLDFGSFVSPKVTPQMKDTAEVLGKLNLGNTKSKLLAIVASGSGAKIAMRHEEIRYVGFPLSVSETFQQRNTNKSISQAFEVLADMQTLCIQYNRTLVVYLSMGFGNPYNEPYNPEIVAMFSEKLDKLGIKIIALSDTIGVSSPSNIVALFGTLLKNFPHIEFGAHFHSNPYTAKEKIAAAYQAGCRRFDVALGGFGGCPMAKDELTGNIATETLLDYLAENQLNTGLNMQALNKAQSLMPEIFDLHTAVA